MENSPAIKKLLALSWVATILYPVWYWLLAATVPGVYDSFWQRLAVPGSIALFSTLFRNRLSDRQAAILLTTGCVLISGHFFFLLLKNDFPLVYVAGGVLLAAFMGQVLHSFRHAVVFFSFLGISSVLGSYAPDAIAAHFYWMGGVFSSALISIWSLYEKEQLLNQIQNQQMKLVEAAKLSTLGEMAGGIAHEINNPLAIIVGKAQLMKSFATAGRLDIERVLKTADQIDLTAQRISKIVKGLRSFARDAEKDPFVRVSVKHMVDEAFAFCQARMGNLGIEIKMVLESEEMELDCRSIQIQQVLLNLLHNAQDAIEPLPEKWIRLEAKDYGDWVHLMVIDSGKGIPVPILSRIMQPFFTTKPQGKGTGLGLSISRGIVEQHGGSLFVDRMSQNTCFVIRLPKRQSMMKKDPSAIVQLNKVA